MLVPEPCEAHPARSSDDTRSRLELADILRRFGPSYGQTHSVSPVEQRLIDDLIACRTAQLGGHLDYCTQCGFERLAELFGVPMRVGSMSQSEKTPTEGIAEPVQAAREEVEAQRVAHLDETSWREGGKRAWRWVALTSLVTVFLIRMQQFPELPEPQ